MASIRETLLPHLIGEIGTLIGKIDREDCYIDRGIPKRESGSDFRLSYIVELKRYV